MAFDLNQYWTEIAGKAGLSEEQTALVGGALGDEAVAKALNSGFVPRPEVDRSLDALKKETRETALKEAKVGYDDWYYKEALPKVTALQDENDRYKKERGSLTPIKGNDTPNPALPDAAGIMKEVMDKVNGLLTDRDAATVNLWQDGLTIGNAWQRQFPGEELPVEELREFAEQHNLRPADAFKQFIAPRLEKIAETRHEKELVTAREEGAKDALSKLNLPTDTTPKEPSPFFTKPELGEDGKAAPLLSDVAKKDMFMEGLREGAGAE